MREKKKEKMQDFQLVIHGGVGDTLPPMIAGKIQETIEKFADLGAILLSRGMSAVDVVEFVIRLFESNRFFNAGIPGSARTREGLVELDAGIMDGKTLRFGGVTHSKNPHPISVARKFMKSRFCYRTDGDLPTDVECLRLLTREYKIWRFLDTVGAVARDRDGNLAAGTSSGGIHGKPEGRISDSSICGAGFYADNRTCGASVSGVGEDLLRRIACAQLHFRLLVSQEILGPPKNKKEAQFQLQQAANRILETFPPHTIGMIAIDSFGNLYAKTNCKTFVIAERF